MRWMTVLVTVAGLAGISTHGEAADPPNVLIVMADDCTFRDLPMYGGENAKTPNLQKFAEEGLLFERASLASAMCQPCRAELFTGQYPMTNGCAWNHSASREGTQSLPQRLEPLGYRVGLSGKSHVKPESVFPFEIIEGFDGNCVRNPTQECSLDGVREFITRDEGPFCLVIALVEPHVPWVMGDPSQYPPKKIKLPPNLVDNPETRKAYSSYLAEITYMDGQVGQILGMLEDAGVADETLVLFTSEQGSQFPGNKWTTWDTGLHTALIARWPGQVPAGKKTSELVQYADVVPTLMELAGGEVPEEIDGVSFLQVLMDEGPSRREFQYASHNNVPEGPPYPIRSVSDGKYRYIRNLTPEGTYIEKHVMGGGGAAKLTQRYWPSWMWTASEEPAAYELVRRYTNRPPEALYNTSADPYELENVVENPDLEPVRKRLSEELDRWMASQGDPGEPQDTTEALRAARQGRHLYVPPSQPGR